MVVILVALSIEGWEVDKWHINSCDGRVNQVKDWGEQMVVDLTGVEVSHHSFCNGRKCDASQQRGPRLLSSCRRRMTKCVHGGGVVDSLGLRAMVAGYEGLEWVSSIVRVLTIGLFTIKSFCHRLRLATDVDSNEFVSFLVSWYSDF
ncbi:hypothetical protein PVK06_019694 [Gossypium arboreum]|uniref:Uncharacterized protein n=1 Tax=Gossypium arboreum TaxID=29729 RepID=A0ABR0PKI0_GOSAR|nr:hypothetical protein PVK06_019694 [Gossypium arboreum]